MCESAGYDDRSGGCRASGPYGQHAATGEVVAGNKGSRFDPGQLEWLITAAKEVRGPTRAPIHL